MKYRKKPVVIEAVRWTGENVGEINGFCNPVKDYTVRNTILWSKDKTLLIKTLEGNMLANVGDYIIKGVNGEYYPCKPDVFAKTYERVEE